MRLIGSVGKVLKLPVFTGALLALFCPQAWSGDAVSKPPKVFTESFQDKAVDCHRIKGSGGSGGSTFCVETSGGKFSINVKLPTSLSLSELTESTPFFIYLGDSPTSLSSTVGSGSTIACPSGTSVSGSGSGGGGNGSGSGGIGTTAGFCYSSTLKAFKLSKAGATRTLTVKECPNKGKCKKFAFEKIKLKLNRNGVLDISVSATTGTNVFFNDHFADSIDAENFVGHNEPVTDSIALQVELGTFVLNVTKAADNVSVAGKATSKEVLKGRGTSKSTVGQDSTVKITGTLTS